MSQEPFDSPYRDAPSPASTVSHRPARKSGRSSSSPRREPVRPNSAPAHQSHSAHASPAGGTTPKRRRKRRGNGTSAAPTSLTSHPTSRNAYVETRHWLLEQHGPVCAYCGQKFSAKVMTLDHVAPRRGQTAYDRRDNLVLACPGCNMIKRDQPPLSFLLGARVRAANLLRYGSHLSPMLVELARSLAPIGAEFMDDESPYAD